MAIATLASKSDKGASSADKLNALSGAMGGVEKIGNSIITASNMQNQASSYQINSALAERDADSAIAVSMKNVAILNVQKSQAKASVKSSAAGSGFAVSSAMYADRVAANELQYRNTIAETIYEGEVAKNASIFEARSSAIQSDYMNKIANVSAIGGVIQGGAQIVGNTSIALADKKGEV